LKVRRGNLAAAAAVLACGVLVPAAEAGAGKSAKTKLISVSRGGTKANEDSNIPSISANGRFVTFDSRASNLVRSDGNDLADIFVRDVKTGKTRLVNLVRSDTNGNRDVFVRGPLR
jgi:hypothetical protein